MNKDKCELHPERQLLTQDLRQIPLKLLFLRVLCVSVVRLIFHYLCVSPITLKLG